jgi:hypothetical protein
MFRSKAWWWPRRWSSPWLLKLRLKGNKKCSLQKRLNHEYLQASHHVFFNMHFKQFKCNGRWGGDVCGSWGKDLGSLGAGPPGGGKGWQLASDSGGEET